jgi:hypothetical protein
MASPLDYDSLIYRPAQPSSAPPVAPTPNAQPAPQPTQERREVSFDDPIFIDHLIKQGSPELAEQVWAEAVGWNDITRSIDNEMVSLKQANPHIASGMITAMGESKKTELRAMAPGLQSLQIAKQRLTSQREAVNGLTSKFNGKQWARLNQLVSEGADYNSAAAQTAAEISFDQEQKEAGSDLPRRPRTGGGTGESTPTATANLMDALADAGERVKSLKDMELDPELTYQAVQDAVADSNQPDVAIDEKDPDSAVRAEQVQFSKTRAKLVFDAVTELNRRGKSPVLLADKDTFLDTAVRSVQNKKPVLVQLPGGKFDYRAFTNRDEILEFQDKTIAPAEREQLAKSLPPEYKPNDGIVEKAKRFTGFKDLEKIEKDLAYYEQQAKDPAKSVADQTDALLQVKDLEELRGKKSKDKERKGVISEYMKLEEMQSRLREQSNNPKLDRDQRDRVRTELAAVKEQIDAAKKHPAIVEYFKMIRGKADGVPWY